MMSKLGYIMAFVLVSAVLATPAFAFEVDRYIKDLKDENSTVRFEAVAALAAAWTYGWLNDTRSVEPLIQALNDTDWRVRAAAALVLSETKDTSAM